MSQQDPAPASATPPQTPGNPTPGTPSTRSVLGLVFLTVFIDLIGFAIIFPLFPAMLDHYLGAEGSESAIGRLVGWLAGLVEGRGDETFAVYVLFGGALGSIYSALQFVFAPVWGALSDRIGRRPAILITLAGTAASYLLWFFAGSFLLLVLARVLGGIMAGNISTASAAVADISEPRARAKNMAVIGMAVGLGFVVGPALGALAYSSLDVLSWTGPDAAAWGINPFSGAALAAFILSLLNLVWAWARFPETRRPEAPSDPAEMRAKRSPFKALRDLNAPGVTRANLTYFLYGTAFAAMEFTLVFLAADRLGFGPRDNAWMFVFIGLTIAFVQGGFVRRMAPKVGEKKLLVLGLALMLPGFIAVGAAGSIGLLYVGLALLATGSALAMPTLSALVSLYSPEERQGLALGAFRSMGALSRAIGPILGGVLYWSLASWAPYYLGAAFLVLPLVLAMGLPDPRAGDPTATAH